jgi:hypothetical protein
MAAVDWRLFFPGKICVLTYYGVAAVAAPVLSCPDGIVGTDGLGEGGIGESRIIAC